MMSLEQIRHECEASQQRSLARRMEEREHRVPTWLLIVAFFLLVAIAIVFQITPSP